MTAADVAPRWRRGLVHPWVLTAVLVVAAAALAGVGLLAGAPTPILLTTWLLLAMAAGFAISGSV